MSPEATRQLMAKAIADVEAENKAKNPQPTLTPEQELLERCVQQNRAAALKFKGMMKLRVTPMTQSEFVEGYYKVLRQEFNALSKDEALTIACIILATMAIPAVKSELI